MQVAPSFVHEKNPRGGEDTADESGLHFCPLEVAAEAFCRRTAGKTLFVADESSFARLAFAAARPAALSVVLAGGDALPLFAMPEGVGAVFAAGKEQTLIAARFYAGVRGLPCALAPSDGALYGALCKAGGAVIDGSALQTPLQEAEVYCDLAFMRPTLHDALARISLARLARFEARALTVFVGEKRPLAEAETGEITEKSVVLANAALRRSEADGAWEGEGAALLRLYLEPDVRRAAEELTALYHAFFKCGKPRKYTVPHYAARARKAETPYGGINIPTAEEYARRSLMLERRRADLLRELTLVMRKNSAETDSVYAFSKKRTVYGGVSAALLQLPEHCPDGLTAVIRDFGLLEAL